MLRTIEQRLRPYLKAVFPERVRKRKFFDFYADGMGVKGRNLSHLTSKEFVSAWELAVAGNIDGFKGSVPDIRWRAHTCIWAARHALLLDGDFVECGVNTGLLSMTVCHAVDFGQQPRRFFLYDTFEGIPADELSGSERDEAITINAHRYFDCYEIAKRNFDTFPNVNLVRGRLPGSLAGTLPERIAYLSIDLNSATFEHQTIEALWPRMVPGAVVVIDDYGFAGKEPQFAMWNEFAATYGTTIMNLPTGQGVLLKG